MSATQRLDVHQAIRLEPARTCHKVAATESEFAPEDGACHTEDVTKTIADSAYCTSAWAGNDVKFRAAPQPLFTRRRLFQTAVASALWGGWALPVGARDAGLPCETRLAALTPRLQSELTDVRSVRVLDRGETVYAYDREGWNAQSLHAVQSVTKSVVSLLFGVALAEGRVAGFEALVSAALPELLQPELDARVRQLQWRHLLGLTAGWAPERATVQRLRDDDVLALARRPFAANPGERFSYDNGAFNLAALGLARRVASSQGGRKLSDWAAERLFTPLGIDRFEWLTGTRDHNLGAAGLKLTANAMVRLGELVRLGGVWQGRALLPAAYLAKSTAQHTGGGPPIDMGYGYGWWVRREVVLAAGYGGQWIMIDPKRELVVTATSPSTPESARRGQAITLIRRDIWPLFARG